MIQLRASFGGVLASVALSAAVAGSAAAQQPYVGIYGGGAGTNFADGELLSSESTTRYLQGQQSGTAERRHVDQSIEDGVPIEIVDELPGRTCPPQNANSVCYRVTEPDRIVLNAQAADGGSVFVNIQGGIRATTTRSVAFDPSFAGAGGVVAGLRFGNIRTELDLGLSVFDVERTETRTTRVETNRAIIPETVDPGLREILQERIDGALADRDSGNSTSVTRSKSTEYVPTLLVNGLYDLPLAGPVTPYVGGGIGAGWYDGDLAFAWNLQGGLQYQLSTKATLQVGYRFQRLEDTDLGDLDSHAGLAGVRFNF